MADVNANINVNVDTSSALSQIKALQRQLSEFYTSISRSSASAAMAQRDLQSNLVNTINSLGGFSAEMRTIKTSAESFTSSLEKNKFSMREYFRYAGASTKTFGSLFKSEFDTINKVAEENVKRLQTQYIKLGRDSTGAMKAIAVMPTSLNLDDVSVKTQMAAQKQALFNQLVKQGSTNLLNFGKNTQWAGRQLMVGFTVPLTILGNTAAKAFMDMETAALKFRKVYGDLFTPAEETQAALDTVKALGESFTKYGIAVSSTVGLAADAAAAGFQGLDLQRQVTEATRLQVLGQVDQQKALETTISLQNAFQMSSEDLSGAINFLNAVENQTVVSLDDITTAIPKAAPVVKQLGGDVKDLAFFMAAMKEGGINASEGANALKSGLASLINPTGKAKEMMMGFGIDIDKIVNKNAGNVKQTVIEFAQALDNLSDLDRQRAIEQLFGKFQLARLSTLFENVTKTGNQASRVLDLATASTADLASMAEKELGMTADSAMNKFKASVENLKLALVPVGQIFLETVTPILDFIGNILDKFDGLSSGTKKAITVITVAVGAIGPVALMAFGLLANAVANGIKFISILRNGYLRLTGQSQILGEQTQYLTIEQQNAAAVAHSLDQSHAKLTQTFNAEKTSVSQLASAYANAARAASNLIMNNPGMVLPGRMPKKFANGVSMVPGSGSGDIVPAMLEPGEAVIPKKMAKKYASLINGMIADNIPGYQDGLSVAEAKHKSKLFSAPSVVRAQTEKMVWDTLTAELEAVDRVAEKFNETLKDNKKLTTEQINNMKRVTAAHKEADTFTTEVDGKTMDVKNWRAANLMPDTGANTFLNTVLQTKGVMEDFEKTGLDVAAKKLGLTMDQARAELDKLKRGIQPQTRAGAGMLGELGSFVANQPPTSENTGRRFQGASTAAIMSERLKGNYYETMGSRSYDPSKDVRATEQVLGRVKKVRMLVLKETEEAATAALVALRRRLGISSPSRETMKIGEQMAEGLRVGIEKGTPGVVASAEAMSTKAANGVRRGSRRASSPGGTVGPGGVIIPPIPPTGGGTFLGMPGMPNDGSRGPITDPKILNQAYRQNRLRNIASIASRPGVGMAASSAFFAASMLPGKMGEIAQKATPVVFGLQALQMGLKFLPGPLKLFAVGLAAVYGMMKLSDAVRERERLAIEGLSDAMVSTTKQTQALGNFFNVIPSKLPFDIKNREIVSAPVRTQRESLKADSAFQAEYKSTIQQLRKATKDEAKLAFTSLALDLKAKGFAAEQVQVIVDALREESGKTDVVLDVKSLNLSPESIKQIQDQMNGLLLSFSQNLKVEPSGWDKFFSGFKQQLLGMKVTAKTMSTAAARDLSSLGTFIASTAKSASGLFELQLIDSKTYEATLSGLLTKTNGLSEANRKLVLIDALGKMGVSGNALIGVLGNARREMMMLALISSGLLKADSKVMENLQKPKNTRAYQNALIQLNRMYRELGITIDNLPPLPGEDDGNGALDGVESAFTRLKKQLQETINNARYSVIAFNKMREAGVGVADALELSKDPLLAQVLATEKSKKNIAIILKLVKTMNSELQKNALDEFLKGLNAGSDLKSKFLPLIPVLEKMGLKSEEIMTLLNNPKVAQQLIKGFKNAQDKAAFLKTTIDGILRDRVMNVRINVSTTEGKAKALSSFASGGIKILDAQAAVIRRAAKTGTTSLIDPNIVKLSADQAERLSKINLDASRKAIETAQAGLKTAQAGVTAAQNDINAKQRLIDLNQGLIDGQQLLIDKIDETIKVQEDLLKVKEEYVELNYDKPLQALSEENNLLSNYQSQIQYQQKAINEAYDKQQQAMEEMNRLNQQSIEQGKQKISIADALSQGDISAAAQAVQDLRAQEAAANSAGMQSMFGAARQGALNNVTAGGMNTAQIEERQYQIQQQSFKLEQDKATYIKLNILPIQEAIKKLEESKIPIQNIINDLTKTNEGYQRDIESIQRTQLYNAEQAVETAELAVTAAEDKLAADEAIVEEVIDQLLYAGLTKEELEKIQEEAEAALAILEDMTASIQAGQAAAQAIQNIINGLQSKQIDIIVNYIATGSVPGGTTTPTEAVATGAGADAAYDAKIGFDRTTNTSVGAYDRRTFGGRIRKYAIGGSVVPGEGLLDSVKALLTPGEFVVNKASAQAYAPLLEAINSQTYPMMNVGRATKNNRSTRNTPMQFDMPNFNGMASGSQKPMVSNINVSQNQTSADNSSAVYNYDVNINISGNNMDTEAVANTVLVKIKQLQDQQIRRRLQ